MDLKHYVSEINRLIDTADSMIEDNPASLEEKIGLLVDAHVLLGDVSAEFYRIYKLLQVQRKEQYWDAYEAAKGNKRMAADRETMKIAKKEAEYAGYARKYHNRFNSIEEQIHALKQKQRANFADGTIGGR